MLQLRPVAAQPTKSAIALLLTFVAGLVDVVGYLAVYHLFTAHVTGTTVHLGEQIALRHWTTAAMAASVVVGFMAGSVAGRVIIEAGSKKHLQRAASVNIAAEAGLLLGFIPVHSMFSGTQGPERSLLLALLAIAMGLQSATLTRIGPLTIHTTFVTGMINKLGQLISHILFHTYNIASATDPHQQARHRRLRHTTARQAWFFFSIWLVYLAGAVTGTLMYLKVGLRTLYVPVALLATAIVADQLNPLSLREERDQSER